MHEHNSALSRSGADLGFPAAKSLLVKTALGVLDVARARVKICSKNIWPCFQISPDDVTGLSNPG